MAEDPPLSDPRDYVVELSGEVVAGAPLQGDQENTSALPPASPGRPYLSIHFKCCNTFSRIYKSADGTAYAGHCPKCAKPVRVKIGAGGSSNRLFTAE